MFTFKAIGKDMFDIDYSEIFECSTEGLIVCNKAAEIEAVNPSMLSMFGYSNANELLGKKVEVLIPKEFAHSHVSQRDNFIHNPSRRSMGKGRDLRGKKKDGSEFPVEISLSHYGKEEPKMIAFITDISERVKIEDEMKAAKEAEINVLKDLTKERNLNQLKANFVSTVSHEFRTPLSTIFSSAQLIEKYPGGEGQDKRLKHTGKIQASVSLLNNMIEDILSLSKLEEGKVILKQEAVDLQELVTQIFSEVKTIYPNIRLYLEGGNSTIYSDVKVLQHVLMNLIENGCKYGIDGGKVEVGIKTEPENIKITIADNGIGIPDQEENNIYDRFYRAANAENIKGTGLGLNIVRKNLELLGGTVEFESELNLGTTFTINIPKHEENTGN